MTAITKAYAKSEHGQLHYRIALPDGPQTRPPLLCLHQTPSSGAEWAVVMPDLATDRVVIAPDTPGYGMSDQPPAPLSIPDFARIMKQFMTDLADSGVIADGPFDIMGAHTGSITATEMGRAWPEQVRRLVLYGLAAYEADIRKTKLDTLYDKFPRPGADLTHIEKLWAIFGQLSDPRMSMEERHVRMAECLSLGARMPWAYEAVYRYDFLQAMSEIAQPVLILNPQDDLWDVTLATSDRFRNGQRLDMPGLKHGALTLAKTQIVDAIQAFLA
ncbi:MAG: alpha/beta fold hydrolase [Caulobacteraceae bacterium]